ncbi:MAG: hypothetical protein CMH47_15205 [Muricauda sp.]|nr:hypothetical protein [Allomuricauda sp.]|tara:strand:+ start:744 stop:1031 length:288 start_codon:yes stop_codon:yes gene_type:complete
MPIASRKYLKDRGIYTNNINIGSEYQLINKITCNGQDIVKDIVKYNVYDVNEMGLKQVLSNYLSSPIDLIQINSNIELKRVAIARQVDEEDLIKW